MSGHTYTHTHIHTHIHTYTHDNYYNPRCAHAHRGLINTRVWLCVKHTNSTSILPDTDVYHIGIPLQSTYNKHVMVQISCDNSHSFITAN